jgi:hypothetical protein
MNNYTIKDESNTSFGSALLIIAGLLGSLTLQPYGGQGPQPDLSLIRRPPVKIEEISKTFGHYVSSFTGEYETLSLGFEETVTMFYAQLLGMQEPLGKEFEEVLYNNLWDLLVHT